MAYPVSFEADYVEQRSRLTAFFRLILAIPLMIWLYIYAIGATVVLVISWLAIVFTGRYPDGLYNFVAGFTRFLTRFTAYVGLLADPYPPFGGADAQIRRAEIRRNPGKIDDPAPAALDHERNDAAADISRTAQVDRDGAVPGF